MLSAAIALLAGAQVTTNTLLREMVDFDLLTRRPDPYYKTAQASSYDRRSTTTADQTTEGWYANGDWGKYVRTEQNDGRTEYVMADLAGPGAVVRVWSANPFGTVRFYFDGETTPRIECKTRDLLTGQFGLMKPPFGYSALRGTDLYFPIPYAKSLKVTVDDTDENNATRMYYHVGYRTFAPGTQVQSFDMDGIYLDEVARVAKLLDDPDSRRLPTGTETRRTAVAVPARDSLAIELERRSPGAITELVIAPIRPNLPANPRWSDPRQVHNLLRTLFLSLSFDGKRTVMVPVADFFGSPPAGAAYRSFPMEVRENGEMVCRFWMPFREKATVELVNAGPVAFYGEVQIKVSPYRWSAGSRYFHSQWVADRGSTRPFRDFEFLNVNGEGHYVGSTLYVGNTVPGWWGEGDEKVWVDGESFPSTFGTGTEDYYGYAWSDPRPYDKIPYHTQPNAGTPGNFGHISNNRFHVLDPITFERSLKFDMEIWHWVECHATYAATSYWYATAESSAPAEIDASLLDAEELLPPAPVEGAIEGEKMRVVERTGGTSENQGGFWNLSNGEQVWWMDGKPGDRLVLEFEVPMSGTYNVVANLCHAADYGVHEVFVNGTRAGEFDFYGTGVNWKKLSLGSHTLTRGPARIEVRVVRSNPLANPKRHMFGLDYILLEQ
jgi:hypothetical protein